jgi:hypothetical protein
MRVRNELGDIRIARHKWTTRWAFGAKVSVGKLARCSGWISNSRHMKHSNSSLPGRVADEASRGRMKYASSVATARSCCLTPILRCRGKVMQLLGDGAGKLSTDASCTPVEVTERVLPSGSGPTAWYLSAVARHRPEQGLALRTDLPQIASRQPTPAPGDADSGTNRAGPKTTLRCPSSAACHRHDVELTLGMPAAVGVGMNAMAHAVGRLRQDRNTVTSMLAEQGIAASPRVTSDRRRSGRVEARSDALFGAWACGNCLGTVGMSLHHKLCHTLGGSFDLPHAETHTVILPHAAAFNESAAPLALQRVARALGTGQAGAGLFDLASSLGAPTSLKSIGMSESDLDKAAEIATAVPIGTAPCQPGAIRALLDDAYHGRRPRN